MNTEIWTAAQYRAYAKSKESKPPVQARVPLPGLPGKNSLERDYAACLEQQKKQGLIHDWLYEPVGLRLGNKCFYHPDFLVIGTDGQVEIHETKGFWRDDAKVKIKTAAAKFPWFRFVAVTREHASWKYTYFYGENGETHGSPHA